MALKYKVGDKVRIKSLDWYNENKNHCGEIPLFKPSGLFVPDMSRYCNNIMTIKDICYGTCYRMKEDFWNYNWTDEMIEGLAEEENNDCKKCGLTRNSTRCLFMDNCPHNKQKNIMEEETKVGTALNPIELKSNANCLTREMIEEFTEEENEKKLSDESWRYKNIFDSSQYPQSFELPEGYIFKDENGNVINAQKIVLEKKKKEYPKTYEECCKVMEIPIHGGIALVGNWCMEDGYIEQHLETLRALSKLLICRDAYWKIAGDEMGLGKPWEPNWTDDNAKYSIYTIKGALTKAISCYDGAILTFPTEEMRDTFYENFDPDIEICKEFL